MVDQLEAFSDEKLSYAYIPSHLEAMEKALEQTFRRAKSRSKRLWSTQSMLTADRLVERGGHLACAMSSCPDEGAELAAANAKKRVAEEQAKVTRAKSTQVWAKSLTFAAVSLMVILAFKNAVSGFAQLDTQMAEMMGETHTDAEVRLWEKGGLLQTEKYSFDKTHSRMISACNRGDQSVCKTVEINRCNLPRESCDDVCRLGSCFIACNEYQDQSACRKYANQKSRMGR